MNDNSKIISSNVRSSYIRKNIKQDNEIIIYNYNDNKKFNNIAKKINLENMPKRQKKLLLFEQNKNNISLLNIQEHNKSNGKRRNKFIFSDNKDMYGKNSLNLKNNKNNNEENSINKINSGKVQSKQVAYSQRNYKENKMKNNKPINTGKFHNSILKKNNNENTIKENINKSNMDLLPSINNNERNINKYEINISNYNNKVINRSMILKKIDITLKDNDKKNVSFNIIKNNDNDNENDNEMKLKSLSLREKAYYILSQSKILSLCERIIFSRTSEKVSNLISIKDILKSNEIFMKGKIKELEQKIIKYNKVIETPFSPSKIAIISLNLITKEEEDEFQNDSSLNYITNENEKNYYYIFIQLLFILLGEYYNENKNENNANILYDILHKKGFVNFKDYLYKLFILQKFKNEFFNENLIDKYKEILKKLPDLIKYEGEIKNYKFICFSYFILFEANNYWIKFKEHIHLKNKTQHYLDCLKIKITHLYQ